MAIVRRPRLRLSLHTRLLGALALLVLVPSIVGVLITLTAIDARIEEQAQYKIRTDLNLARAILERRQADLKDLLAELRRRIETEGLWGKPAIDALLERESAAGGLDVALVTDRGGRVLHRINSNLKGDSLAGDYFVRRAMSGRPVCGLDVASPGRLSIEGLRDRAAVGIIETPHSYLIDSRIERRGMLIKAATPVHDESGRMRGVLAVAVLVNRDSSLVDQVRSETRGDNTSILLGPVTIATNILTPEGKRALGTAVSEVVGRKVLDGGELYVGEALVGVREQYSISAYEPIRDVKGEIAGILYVGTPMEPFDVLRRRTIAGFALIALSTLALTLVFGSAWILRAVRPIEDLASVAQRMGQGDFSARTETGRRDEVGVLCVEFNNMADKLQSQIEELGRLNELKSEFIAVASHELRTPLTFIRSYVELINKGAYDGQPEQLRERLEKIERNTMRLSSLLDDLLDLSKLERHELTIHAERLSMRRLIAELLSDVSAAARSKGLTLHTTLPDDPLPVKGDEERMRRVFVNLLDNSLKFSKAGDRIVVTGRRADGKVEVRVEDTGAGIAEEDLPFVFSPFFQTEASIRRTHSGLGLGLSLSRNIIELHDGSIEIDSELGSGTAVVVRLPLFDEGGAVTEGGDKEEEASE
ncbi:MAG: HAMP domain-containing protein [Actinobacteria bacterium]|nr:MAG: HAMP domain-containing protein [Actinomycetota bacterium]